MNAPGGQIYQRYYPRSREVLALFIDDPLIAPPGTRVSYSSFGYTLASVALEAAAGEDFRQLIADQIAASFGLQSLTDDDPLAIRPLRVAGFARSFDLAVLISGVVKTIHLENNLGNMPQSNSAFCWAGAGFLMTPSDTSRRWHHAGATPGGRYSLVVYPDLDLAIAMALNVMVVRLDVLARTAELADIFSG